MKPETDEEKIKKLEEMYLLLNHEYQTLITKWIDKDQWAMFMGVILSCMTLLFHFSVNFDKGDNEQVWLNYFGLLVCCAIYYV